MSTPPLPPDLAPGAVWYTDTELEQLRTAKNAAYSERNQCLALMARMALRLGWKAGVGFHPVEDAEWDPEWSTVLFIDLPTGQSSWHFHTSEAHLLAGLPFYAGAWDGHSTPEKYQRVAAALPLEVAP